MNKGFGRTLKKTTSTYLAYGAFAAAVCVWIAVGYFALLIQSEHAAYLDQVAAAATQSDQAAADARLHIFASGNLARAAELDAIVSPDVASIIDDIRSVGIAAGVPVKISNALPGSVPKDEQDIHAVAFVIESTGNFSSLMHALVLFENLPMPLSIETVDLSQGDQQDASTPPHAPQVWHLSIKMQVLTTAIVS